MELEAIGKRPRASSGSSSSLASDRLSSLPDCLIHHIMSFLKARHVVQTCVLSTRWRHLWRSVPCLDIDHKEFKTTGQNRDEEKEWQDFEDFTDHLLIPNNISIALLDTFRLRVGISYFHGRQGAKWIRHGIKYSAQDPGILRKELNFSSWRLRRLHLCSVNLDDSFMKHVSSGCQCLEDLVLKHCRCTFHEITSRTLKNLTLKNCTCSRLSVITSPTLKSIIINNGGCHITFRSLLVITVPAVAYLLLDVNAYFFAAGVSFDDMSSLAKASIYLRNTLLRTKLGKDQFKLLCSVSNVTTLVLSGFHTMVTSEEFPEFQNLTTLLLEKCDLSDNFQTLGYFLEHSPNLEKLTLGHCKFSKDPKKKKGKAKFNVRCKNLKLTEIIYEEDDVEKLVELLLRISGDLPKNNIKLTKVDTDHP